MAQDKIEKDSVTIRFAGDSGDGMQLTGTQFTDSSAIFGNDVSTFPDYPAEIRAPAGSVAGVSGFQIQLANRDIFTPGDRADCLFAMNPAALKSCLGDLDPEGVIVANSDSFAAANLKKAGYVTNPLEDGSLAGYQVHQVPITTLTVNATAEVPGITRKDQERCKNFFALGLAYWIFDRPLDTSMAWIEKKFAKNPAVLEANKRAMLAGYNFGDTTEVFPARYHIPAAKLPPGKYRQFNGNEAIAYGLVAAAHNCNLPLYYASYPITPASDILHTLSNLAAYNVYTFQAEDEIAAMAAAVGASFGGALSTTGTSGPGLCLKSEAINLAVITELPVVIVNVQRGGPSTGLPTKTEQSDLLQAIYGRNGDSPLIVVAPQSPSDAFLMAYEAARLALRTMGPVIVLSDGFIANGAEPWRIVDLKDLPPIETEFAKDPATYKPYLRDAETHARPWAIPGTPGLTHRIGGLEKADVTGNVSYDGDNHHVMTLHREEKVRRVAEFIPEQDVFGENEGELLVVGWGSTYGSIRSAVEKLRAEGRSISHAHIRYLNPFPRNLGAVLERFNKVLVPEINRGQLAWLLKAHYQKELIQCNEVRGVPYKISDLYARCRELLEGAHA